MLIKIILIFFIVFAIFKVALRYRDKIISLQEFLLWTFFWLLVALLVIFPEITSYAANLVGVGRGVDLVVYLAILILFYLSFRLLSRQDKMDKDLTKLVRKIALDNEEKDT
jgi:small membrane protein